MRGLDKKLESKITLGIFGGSFDPPHKGHIKLCEEFSKMINSKVLVMPAKISPFKIEKMSSASAEDRIKMCELAFSHIENVEICDYEIQKDDISFTYLTVKHFLSLNKNEKICLCVGADCLETLECWANAEFLLKNCVIAAAYRYKDAENSFGESMNKLRIKYKAEIIPLYYDPIEISSTELREQIKNSDFSVDNMKEYLSDNVIEYIKNNQLYGG